MLRTAILLYRSTTTSTCAKYPFDASESQGSLRLVEAHAAMEIHGNEPDEVSEYTREKGGYRRVYDSTTTEQRADEV
ncbi:hypothetical protein JCM24511_02052 [Saitozyma sp. JCM 24511]|nr:hypothetical protein JCM24511_02052 [Saitozyma sp. JCM 24511]